MKTQRANAFTPAKRPALPFPVFPGGASLKPLQGSTGLLSSLWRWFRARQAAHSNTRRIQVAATASLGEKRFVALIKIDELQFLIGGGPANVVLLAQVNASERFDEMLKGNLSEPQKQAAKRPYKPIVKPAVKPHVKPTAKLAIKPVLHPITRKPVKAATKPVGKQAVKQVRKQA